MNKFYKNKKEKIIKIKVLVRNEYKLKIIILGIEKEYKNKIFLIKNLRK